LECGGFLLLWAAVNRPSYLVSATLEVNGESNANFFETKRDRKEILRQLGFQQVEAQLFQNKLKQWDGWYTIERSMPRHIIPLVGCDWESLSLSFHRLWRLRLESLIATTTSTCHRRQQQHGT
jgi:hypothetical protein